MHVQPVEMGFPILTGGEAAFHALQPTLEGFGAEATVLCPEGWRPVGSLRPGDVLRTIDGGCAAITDLLVLKATASEDAVFIEIPDGILGATRPTLLAHGQCLYMKHFLASAFFGSIEIMVPARWLVHRGPLRRSTCHEAEFHRIGCARQEIINVNGIWVGTALGFGDPVHTLLDKAQCDLVAQTDAFFRAPRVAR